MLVGKRQGLVIKLAANILLQNNYKLQKPSDFKIFELSGKLIGIP